MSKRKNWIYGISVYVITCVLVLVSAYISSNKYSAEKPVTVFGLFMVGAVVFGFLNTVIHELGHIVIGKKNNFEILSFTFWFFRWTKIKGKYRFSLVMIGDEAGCTESVPKSSENMENRIKAMAKGGPLFSMVMTLISVVPYFFVGKLPVYLFCITAMSFPISFYYFAWNILPITSDGVYNDGAVVYSVKKNTPSARVMVSLLKINSEMYNGKTPCEIEESFFFDVPQLAEDDLFFANVMNARYNYYLDKGNNEEAKKIIERLVGVVDYYPKSYQMAIKADYLYSECLDGNGEKADETMYEVEKYLNNVNTATNVRIKLAYLLLVGAEEEQLELFYKKGIKEAKKSQLKGLGLYETKLLDGLMKK